MLGLLFSLIKGTFVKTRATFVRLGLLFEGFWLLLLKHRYTDVTFRSFSRSDKPEYSVVRFRFRNENGSSVLRTILRNHVGEDETNFDARDAICRLISFRIRLLIIF